MTIDGGGGGGYGVLVVEHHLEHERQPCDPQDSVQVDKRVEGGHVEAFVAPIPQHYAIRVVDCHAQKDQVREEHYTISNHNLLIRGLDRLYHFFY